MQLVLRELKPTILCWAIVVGMIGGFARVETARAQSSDKSPRVETRGIEFMTAETQRAIDDGLAFLARQQKSDGSIGSGRYFDRDVAVTSLCGMSFLAAGHTPGRGKYGKHVQKCVDFVL